MSRPPLQLWLPHDGKPGHLNQALGLAEAIARTTPATIHPIPLPTTANPIQRLRQLTTNTHHLPKPNLTIAAGHRTHSTLLWLAHHHHCPSIVLMKPTIPTSWFSLCLVPQHDLGGRVPGRRVVATVGALNRVVAGDRVVADGRMMLIGGPSAQHGWDGGALVGAIRAIVGGEAGRWEVADSRRTPAGFLGELVLAVPGLVVHPHAGTGPDWLAGRLGAAAEVWVTEDSVSMVYEALTAGARVGLLPAPRVRERSRVIAGLEQLVADGYVTRFADWRAGRVLAAPPARLAEADRCARIVLERMFRDRCHA